MNNAEVVSAVLTQRDIATIKTDIIAIKETLNTNKTEEGLIYSPLIADVESNYFPVAGNSATRIIFIKTPVDKSAYLNCKGFPTGIVASFYKDVLLPITYTATLTISGNTTSAGTLAITINDVDTEISVDIDTAPAAIATAIAAAYAASDYTVTANGADVTITTTDYVPIAVAFNAGETGTAATIAYTEDSDLDEIDVFNNNDNYPDEAGTLFYTADATVDIDNCEGELTKIFINDISVGLIQNTIYAIVLTNTTETSINTIPCIDFYEV
jgi:hypothetical protein